MSSSNKTINLCKYLMSGKMHLFATLKKIVDQYLGLLVFGEKITVLDNEWNVKYRHGLQGVIAFTRWSIPQKEAFNECKDLVFILGVSPISGPDMSFMFRDAISFNQPIQRWDTSYVVDAGKHVSQPFRD